MHHSRLQIEASTGPRAKTSRYKCMDMGRFLLIREVSSDDPLSPFSQNASSKSQEAPEPTLPHVLVTSSRDLTPWSGGIDCRILPAVEMPRSLAQAAANEEKDASATLPLATVAQERLEL